MGQVRHGSATTTHAVRAAIQRSQAWLAQLSRELGINPKTIEKQRKRATVEGRKTGPTEPLFTVLTEAEESMVVAIRRQFAAGVDMAHEGLSDQSAYILAKGWVCSYKLLPNSARLIVDFPVPGDFLGLRSMLFRTADHNIEPVTKVEASVVLASDVLDAFARTPRLVAAVLWAASRDEAMVVEHLVNIGRKNALTRTAHYLLELGARLTLVGHGTKAAYACLLSQYLLAEPSGLSAVNVDRMLRQLLEDGLLTFQDGQVTFNDVDQLVPLADFDTA